MLDFWLVNPWLRISCPVVFANRTEVRKSLHPRSGESAYRQGFYIWFHGTRNAYWHKDPNSNSSTIDGPSLRSWERHPPDEQWVVHKSWCTHVQGSRPCSPLIFLQYCTETTPQTREVMDRRDLRGLTRSGRFTWRMHWDHYSNGHVFGDWAVPLTDVIGPGRILMAYWASWTRAASPGSFGSSMKSSDLS